MENVKRQKAFILTVSPVVVGNAEAGNNRFNNLEDLNELLEDGWHYVSSSPMSGAEAKYSVALIILERD